MQKLEVGQEMELIDVVSLVAGVDQEVPFQLSALPLLSTAMQKLEVGHDTEVKVLVSEVELGVPQLVPL